MNLPATPHEVSALLQHLPGRDRYTALLRDAQEGLTNSTAGNAVDLSYCTDILMPNENEGERMFPIFLETETAR